MEIIPNAWAISSLSTFSIGMTVSELDDFRFEQNMCILWARKWALPFIHSSIYSDTNQWASWFQGKHEFAISISICPQLPFLCVFVASCAPIQLRILNERLVRAWFALSKNNDVKPITFCVVFFFLFRKQQMVKLCHGISFVPQIISSFIRKFFVNLQARTHVVSSSC